MANFRRFRPDDLHRVSKCNLDPFTETYELSFYLQYHAKWPSLFQVAEDQDGNIIGYSKTDRHFPPRRGSTASSVAGPGWAGLMADK